ncbi:CGNR zinc finger domain-containing protein [Nesterenkonia sp. CL21]|uniref:CGNR zinc finger domain-containing protein n=1 Tax=Nesterenkonia sp. CL21 TaxID=3064894 RepID=UPI00287AA957|nr:CGNR zinc finger domain-containing protein [Nesterenkonia sp. CL21]MDS2172300.1 CGNR zinc finger domain-containing protein [Nesterenkonia sp. CL21]
MTPDAEARDWLFYGGSPALNFVNTLRDRATAPRETVPDAASLARWFTAAGIEGWSRTTAQEPTPAEHVAALSLRDAIDAVLAPERTPTTEHASLVNDHARHAPMRELDLDDPTAVVVEESGTTAALGTLAHEAIAIIAAGEGPLVKVCAHSRCGLRYLDRSRGGRRQWCSMERCGNRAKAARHVRRGVSAGT